MTPGTWELRAGTPAAGADDPGRGLSACRLERGRTPSGRGTAASSGDQVRTGSGRRRTARSTSSSSPAVKGSGRATSTRFPRRRPRIAAGSATITRPEAFPSRASRSAWISAPAWDRGTEEVLTSSSPPGASASRHEAMNAPLLQEAGTLPPLNTSRTMTSHCPGRSPSTTSAASPTRMRSLGERGRSNQVRTRAARTSSISTATCWEPGRVTSHALARAQPAPPRWRALTGPPSPRSAVSAASICWWYSKSRCAGSRRSRKEDSAPSSMRRIPVSRATSSAVAKEVRTGPEGRSASAGAPEALRLRVTAPR